MFNVIFYDTIELEEGVTSIRPTSKCFLNTLENGSGLFMYDPLIENVNLNLNSLKNGTKMFYQCENIVSIPYGYDLYNNTSQPIPWMNNTLENATQMFSECQNLQVVVCSLPNLKISTRMFEECDSLLVFSGGLDNLEDASEMFENCANLIAVESNFPKLKNAQYMFRGCHALTDFSRDANFSTITNASWMFSGCEKITSFNYDLSSLIIADRMFDCCNGLTNFSSDMSSLINGYQMFEYCKKLIDFNADLSSLVTGNQMFFNCDNLKSFTTNNLNSLVVAESMFQRCSSLTSFNSDLNSLVNGSSMFTQCTSLTSCTSDLSSLVDGGGMFYQCNLNPQSVMYILESINNLAEEKKLYTDGIIPYVTYDNGSYSAKKGFMENGKYVYTYIHPYNSYNTTDTISASDVGKLTLGINVTNDASTIEQQLLDFANEASYDSWADLKKEFVDKGWTVTFQYGGTNTNITYDLRTDKPTPLPIYARLEEVENKDSAQYCNEDATKFYIISWGHDVTNPQDFQIFDSLEDACASFGVFNKDFIETQEVPQSSTSIHETLSKKLGVTIPNLNLGILDSFQGINLQGFKLLK